MGGDWKDFFHAIQKDNIELVKYHIRTGIDPNYQHPEYMTAPLMECIRYDRLDIAQFLLENGADVNAKEHGGKTTALSIAQMYGKKEAVELLRKFGAK